jgi:hypothetical protein
MDWLRWWHGTVTDPKFQWVARKSGQGLGNVLAVWAALLECASNATQCNEDATRGNVASFDCNDFDVLLGLEDGDVQKIYDAMTQKKLIENDRLSQWEARQPKREDAGNPSTGALSSTERSRLYREKQRKNEIDATQCNAMQRNATQCNDREEESRLELTSTTTNVVVVGNDVANACPHQEIISLYHGLVPVGTRVRIWNGTRSKHLQARWREDAKRQDLLWWKKFFEYVSQSEFLTGQTPPARDRDPFVVSLDWLVNPQNFAKVIEGRYNKGNS